MGSFNKIILVGYLGRDPESRYIPSGNSVCNFSVATTEKRGNEESTTWFRITVWGKQGENCQEYLRKGSQVYVEGRLRQDEYTDRDGNKRFNLEVNASDVRFLSSRNGGGDREEAPTRKVTRQEVAQAIEEAGDDEIPF